MPMPANLAYEDVLAFVRTYRNGHGEPVPYDTNGVIHLLLAALDNLCEHQIAGDLEQLRDMVTERQRQALVAIGCQLRRVPAQD